MKAPPTLDAALEAAPTSIAAPALACRHALTAGELAAALRFLEACVHGFLHAAACARLRHGSAPALASPPAFTRAWQWGDPETVMRWHAHFGGDDAAWIAGPPWPAALVELAAALHAEAAAERALAAPDRTALEGGLRELLALRLACTHGWTLFHHTPLAAGEGVLVFRGPAARLEALPFALPAHGAPGMYLHLGGEIFPLEPFCRRTRPAFAPSAQKGAAEEVGRPILHVLTALGKARASVALPGIGLIQQRNDFADAVWTHLARPALVQSAPEETWGVMLLRVRKMREFNQRYGYAAGDRIIAAMDACARRYAWSPGALPGALTAHPFWRRGSELLIPFCTAGAPDLVTAAGGALELAGAIAAAAHAAARAGRMKASLQAGLHLQVGTHGPGRPSSEPLQHELLAASEAVRADLAGLGPVPVEGTLWRLHPGDAAAVATRNDGPFTRVSRAVFGLIRREVDGRYEYLLRFNDRHRRFNFVGGHVEPEDGDAPLRTLRRELREELALAPESYTATPVFPGPLHHLAFSAAHDAQTLYVHHFFAIAGLTEAMLRALAQPDCRWFPAERLGAPASPEISPDPLAALAARMDLRSGRVPEAGHPAETLRLLFGFEPPELRPAPLLIRGSSQTQSRSGKSGRRTAGK